MPLRATASLILAMAMTSAGVLAGAAGAAGDPHRAADDAAVRATAAAVPTPPAPAAAAGQAGEDPAPADDCTTRRTAGTNCQAGNGRRVAGGGEKVSHAGWPAVTGLLWIAQTAPSRTYVGTAANDELLSHHASDTVRGLAGDDIIWGDWDPKGNTTAQTDRLDGGDGDDRIYTSHGRNIVSGGAGDDFIWAYYGHGTIDCGPGRHDTAKIHLDGNPYRVRGCERILNFCAFGSVDGTRCAKPGEKRAARTSR